MREIGKACGEGYSLRTARKAVRWNPVRRKAEGFVWPRAAWRHVPGLTRAHIRGLTHVTLVELVVVDYDDTWCEPIMRDKRL